MVWDLNGTPKVIVSAKVTIFIQEKSLPKIAPNVLIGVWNVKINQLFALNVDIIIIYN